MVLAAGTRLGPYEILTPLGAGGMGEVYRARDTRLGREAALKVLPPELSSDADRLRRFQQEARAASALNHPNIVTVYDIGREGTVAYLAMELVQGQSLRELLVAGPLPSSRLPEVAVQVAAGLAQAHAAGIVHRDIKPENILVRSDGLVKILDFGLAKLGAVPADADSRLPTAIEAPPKTRTGTVLGTVAYMSPEQARGEAVDGRSDIFSFGAVLYEMATGQHAFSGSTSPVVFDAILNRQPVSPSRFNRELSPRLEQVLTRALEKDRGLRYQGAADLLADLKRLERDSAPGAPIPAAPPRSHRVALAVGAVLALALVAGGGFLLLKPRSRKALRPSLAVLPFQALGEDRGSDFLRLALPDEIVTTLSYFPSMTIRPFSQTRKYDRTPSDPQAAGRELQVDDILTGHFVREADRIQVTLEVVDVAENRLVWRETVTAGAQDLIALKERIVAGLRQGLLPRFGGASAKGEGGAGPRNVEAYAIYLRSLAAPRDAASNRQAIATLEQAVALDPGFAPAWRQLGRRYYTEAEYGGGGPPYYEKSRQAIARAVQLDPAFIEAATDLVNREVEAGHLESADDEAQRLARLRPDSISTHLTLAYVSRYAGLLDESARECEGALAIDPKSFELGTCALTFLMLNQYDRALEFSRLSAGSEFAKLLAADIALRRGDASARPMIEGGAYEADGSAPLFLAFYRGAPRSEIHNAAEQFASRWRAEIDSEVKYSAAGPLAFCGEKDLALSMLRKALEGGYVISSAMDRDPLFRGIRSDPEFFSLRAQAVERQKRFLAHRAERGRAA